MSSGPSKEELENYWKSSRQYFDELAKYYQQSDPTYYKEYIQPFYSNPFHSSSSTSKSGSGGAIKLVAVMVLLAVLGIGAAAFFILMKNTDSDEPKVKEKRVESIDKSSSDSEEETKTESADDDDELSPEDNFIIGSKYIGDKEYDKAEKHLRRIEPGQKYYKEAQQLLESIKYLKKYDK